ncbi:MAG: hypothetical protein SFW36_09160 [Leptolyngbyaceae cyanobacterium bins.59]|nr:hypothetical protein [Leptolyngbyaceae cyanobacterium bins.59]
MAPWPWESWLLDAGAGQRLAILPLQPQARPLPPLLPRLQAPQARPLPPPQILRLKEN